MCPDLGNYDIYTFSLQEVVALKAKAMFLKTSPKLIAWESKIQDHLGSRYIKLFSRQMFGLAIVIFAKEEHVRHLQNVQFATVSCGLMGGVVANKGGISVSMELYQRTICFVATHMTSGRSKNDRRANDYHTIVHSTQFKSPKMKILDHAVVFWLGDLNYRIDELPDPDVKAMIALGDISGLLKYDQLTRHRLSGAAFDGFSEGTIDFVPTYRYDIGTDTWDTSHKHQVPAWCDRVLWRVNEQSDPDEAMTVTALHYGRYDYRSSDHRPVSAVLEVSFPLPPPDETASPPESSEPPEAQAPPEPPASREETTKELRNVSATFAERLRFFQSADTAAAQRTAPRPAPRKLDPSRFAFRVAQPNAAKAPRRPKPATRMQPPEAKPASRVQPARPHSMQLAPPGGAARRLSLGAVYKSKPPRQVSTAAACATQVRTSAPETDNEPELHQTEDGVVIIEASHIPTDPALGPATPSSGNGSANAKRSVRKQKARRRNSLSLGMMSLFTPDVHTVRTHATPTPTRVASAQERAPEEVRQAGDAAWASGGTAGETAAPKTPPVPPASRTQEDITHTPSAPGPDAAPATEAPAEAPTEAPTEAPPETKAPTEEPTGAAETAPPEPTGVPAPPRPVLGRQKSSVVPAIASMNIETVSRRFYSARDFFLKQESAVSLRPARHSRSRSRSPGRGRGRSPPQQSRSPPPPATAPPAATSPPEAPSPVLSTASSSSRSRQRVSALCSLFERARSSQPPLLHRTASSTSASSSSSSFASSSSRASWNRRLAEVESEDEGDTVVTVRFSSSTRSSGDSLLPRQLPHTLPSEAAETPGPCAVTEILIPDLDSETQPSCTGPGPNDDPRTGTNPEDAASSETGGCSGGVTDLNPESCPAGHTDLQASSAGPTSEMDTQTTDSSSAGTQAGTLETDTQATDSLVGSSANTDSSFADTQAGTPEADTHASDSSSANTQAGTPEADCAPTYPEPACPADIPAPPLHPTDADAGADIAPQDPECLHDGAHHTSAWPSAHPHAPGSSASDPFACNAGDPFAGSLCPEPESPGPHAPGSPRTPSPPASPTRCTQQKTPSTLSSSPPSPSVCVCPFFSPEPDGLAELSDHAPPAAPAPATDVPDPPKSSRSHGDAGSEGERASAVQP